ncbi:tRNA (guanosine(37)-N1)-methyltransferase TrmD [Ammonifex thiophilus]|uniref:tRNA (guanine-N(1)-)-methyltransferase n=1 Tax=Ammonifex thiophilus TaxID=444093 RepID=A0A3D8P335_9THEO|nr:tRNA (guanosine(37)-N1)-methyltransferase TrmD [Ammonifex thiophilus]RDV81164.1 tRNA (guanosine(37)-N1)-methyltransferase TrmD [Ammonifex thiophilus]
MVFDILTLFPEMFQGPFSASQIKRARERGLLEINLVNIRDYSPFKHREVDDAPFGGGGGMILRPEPIYLALEAIRERRGGKLGPVILLCPQGERFTQRLAWELAREEHLVLICGHYEGVDERVRRLATGEISIGDFVLTGGELAAMVVVDAVARLLPGVLGDERAPVTDSFAGGLLEHPHYTRPRVFQGEEVPEVLTSGHHARIARWRREESILRTLVRRPDLLSLAELTEEDRKFLRELKQRIEALGL